MADRMLRNRMTPEEKAREKIDSMLAVSGWIIQDYKVLNLSAGCGISLDHAEGDAIDEDEVITSECRSASTFAPVHLI
jgi:hypothetical protein